MTVFETLRKALLAGVGAQEKVRELIDEFIKRGEMSESQGAKLIREWTEQAEKSTSDISKSISDALTKTLEKMRLPRKADIDELSAKIQTLSERVKRLEEKD